MLTLRPMKITNFRLIITLGLCLACIAISYYHYHRTKIINQNSMRKIHAHWQNQQLNQYLGHRLLLSVHREPMGLSQWNQDLNESDTFCDAIKNAMGWPTQWITLSSLDNTWLQRFALDKWFISENTQPSDLTELIKSAQIKIDYLSSESNSLCSLKFSSQVRESEPIYTILNFSSKHRENLQ